MGGKRTGTGFSRSRGAVYDIAACIALAAAVFIIYGESFHHEFVKYDDDVYITDNIMVQKGFTPDTVAWAFSTGVSLIESELQTMAEENGKVYGEDYVYLGYRPYPATVILSMGQDFRQSFPIDFYGTPLDSLPMMQGIRNYRNVELVLSINATSGVDSWIMYGRERYGHRKT